jgi:hypothetical protein
VLYACVDWEPYQPGEDPVHINPRVGTEDLEVHFRLSGLSPASVAPKREVLECAASISSNGGSLVRTVFDAHMK